MTPKRRHTSRSVQAHAKAPASPWPANVRDLRLRVLPRHLELVARWLDAGRAMGLCDAAPFYPEPDLPGAADYLLVWVRENADPAYMISPDGMYWKVTDCVRNLPLVRVRGFEEALHVIRPVLPLPQPSPVAAPWAGQQAASSSMRPARMNSPSDHA
jgi:hypothetical protein